MAMRELVTTPSTTVRTEALSDPELRRALLTYVARRLNPSDAEDVVQATLTEAFASQNAPAAPEELRRWVFGIARNKLVDVYRRTKREAPLPDSGLSDDAAVADSAPLSARELLRWAEKELPDNQGADSTLEWMLREGDGEKLEHIAEDAKLPPARVRQRVSRMRKHFRARWAAQLAAAAAFAVLALAAWVIWRGRAIPTNQDIAEEKRPDAPRSFDQAHEIRRLALEQCDAEKWQPCLDGLDRAKKLDPDGDRSERVQNARAAAARATQPAPPVPSTTTSAPPPPAKTRVDSLQSPAPPVERKKEPPPERKGTNLAPKPKAPAKKTETDFDEKFSGSAK
jgi:DNA-directed RNA polymerase specialized sigma24 family protein